MPEVSRSTRVRTFALSRLSASSGAINGHGRALYNSWTLGSPTLHILRERFLFLSPSTGYGGDSHGSTSVSRSSSSLERGTPHYLGSVHRRDHVHLPGECCSSTRDQPRLDSQAGTFENRIYDPVEYIRAWQGTLQTAIPPIATCFANKRRRANWSS